MKSFKTLTIRPAFWIILCAFAFGCGDPAERGASDSDDDSRSSASAASTDMGEVRFNLDGVQWVSGAPGHPNTGMEEDGYTDGQTMIRIEAFAPDGSSMALNIFDEAGIGPGTYPITNANLRGFYKTKFENGQAYLSSPQFDDSGYLALTSFSADRAVGTFAFPMRDSGNPDDVKQVTDGSFDVRFN